MSNDDIIKSLSQDGDRAAYVQRSNDLTSAISNEILTRVSAALDLLTGGQLSVEQVRNQTCAFLLSVTELGLRQVVSTKPSDSTLNAIHQKVRDLCIEAGEYLHPKGLALGREHTELTKFLGASG